MTAGHRAFPPGRGFVAVPTSTRSGGAGRDRASTPVPSDGDLGATGNLAPRRHPRAESSARRATSGVPPIPQGVWTALAGEWSAIVGGFDTIAAYRPRQRSRSGHGILLIRDGAPQAFVR